MNNCKLCSSLPPPNGLDGNNASQEMDKPKAHAAIHQRQLQMITGRKLSLEEIIEKCFGIMKVTEDNSLVAGDSEFKWKGVRCPISKVCFEIYNKNGRKDIMTCSQCGNNLKVKGAWFRCGLVKEHACMHLGKDLFQCSICERKSCTQSAMGRHLVTIHKLAGNSKNCTSRVSDHQAEIISTIKLCFGKRPNAECKQEDAGQLPKWKRNGANAVKCPVSKACHDIYKKQGSKRRMECSLCQRSLKVIRCGNLDMSIVKNHACAHLDKAMMHCRICDYKGSTQVAIKKHLNVNHKLSGAKSNYIDRTSDYEAEIIAMIGQCFGEQMAKPEPKVKQDAFPQIGKTVPKRLWKRGNGVPMSTITKVCFEVHENQHGNDCMKCSECGGTFKVMNEGHFVSARVKDHACTHMDNDIFECRFCEYKRSTHTAIRRHLGAKHELAPSTHNYIDHTFALEKDIIAKIRNCFGMTQSIASTPKSPIRFRTSFSTSCRKLMKGKDKNSKMTCSVCGKQAAVFNLGHTKLNVLVDHVCTHLEKKPYQCKLCEFEASKKTGLSKHLKITHQSVYSSDTCNDLSEEMTCEILDMVKRCFGNDPSQSAHSNTKDRLKKIYNQLFEHCKSSKRVECTRCYCQISLRGGLRGPLDHARNHFGSLMFKCKICGYRKASTRACIVSHLRKKHQITSQVMSECEDYTEKFEKQLGAMMIECFGKKDRSGNQL